MKFPVRMLISGFILGCLVSCASSSSSKKSATIEGLLNIAGASISEGDYITALEYLSQADALDSANPRAHHLYSLAYLGKREFALAEASVRESLRLNPQYSSAKNTLGKILMDLGKFTEAEGWLRQAASDLLNREADRAKLNLGILSQKTLKADLAEYWFNRVIEERTSLACLAHFQLGRMQIEKNELSKAERNFRLAAKGSCSGLSEPHLAIGQVLSRQRRYEEARAKYVEIQRIFAGTDASEKALEQLRALP
jgi:type IV pilus assembly protein PilF